MISTLKIVLLAAAGAIALPNGVEHVARGGGGGEKPDDCDTKPVYKCGKVDVLFDGLPSYHPLVAAAGFNQDAVDAAIQLEIKKTLAAGYNLRSVFLAPEAPLSDLADELARDNIDWDGLGIGFGSRSAPGPALAVRFEDIVKLYRETNPEVVIAFNYSPNSTLEAIQRNYPIEEDCSEKPGRFLGYSVFCSTCSKVSTYNG